MNYISCSKSIFFFHGVRAPSGPRLQLSTLRHTALGGSPLEEWSACRRNLYLTAHNTHNRQTSMLPAEFEPAIPASQRPQTHHSATGIGYTIYANITFKKQLNGYLSYWAHTLSSIFIYEPRGFCHFVSNILMCCNGTCWQHCMSETGAHATWLYRYCLIIHIYWIVNTAVYLVLFFYI